MQELVQSLKKRRIVTIYIVILFAISALIYNHNFQVSTPTYFDGIYNMYFVYGLIIYKLIELIIIYYLLLHRYLIRLRSISYSEEEYPKLKKHVKLLFFLVPQGNTIFGIIAYKLSGNVLYFLLFSLIALITLLLLKPASLNSSDKVATLN